jgi:hypothetical protein
LANAKINSNGKYVGFENIKSYIVSDITQTINSLVVPIEVKKNLVLSIITYLNTLVNLPEIPGLTESLRQNFLN